MPRRIRAFLTPDAWESDTVCRSLSIPSWELWHYIDGALALLSDPYNWEQFGTKTPDEMAETFAEIFALWNEECMNCEELLACLYGTGKQFRVNPTTGEYESSSDGGETWVDDPSLDPRVISPRLGLDGAFDCTDARYVVGGIQQFIDEIKDVITAGSGIVGLTAALTTIAVSILSVGTLTPLFVGLGSAVLGFTVVAIDAALTSAVWERLVCNILCNLEDTSEVTHEQWQAVLAEITADESGIAETILWNVVNFLGAVGLQNVAAMRILGAGVPADCDDCNCTPCASYTDGFDVGFGAKTSLNTTFAPIVWNWGGAWQSSGGRTSPGCITTTTAGGKRNISIKVDLGQECNVTQVSAYVVHSSNVANNARFAAYNAANTQVGLSIVFGGTPVAWTQHIWNTGGVTARYIQLDFATDAVQGLMDDISVVVT